MESKKKTGENSSPENFAKRILKDRKISSIEFPTLAETSCRCQSPTPLTCTLEETLSLYHCQIKKKKHHRQRGFVTR
jgi:predicted outer membrane protein